MISNIMKFSIGIMFVFVFVFSMVLTDTKNVIAADPPATQICCTKPCATNSQADSYGAPTGVPGVCDFTYPPVHPFETCLVLVKYCNEEEG